MIELKIFLDLVDRGIQLLKTRKNNRRELFVDIIAPLNKEFEEVALAYILLFKNARKKIKESSVCDINTVMDELIEERDHIIMARIKPLELANLLADQHGESQVVRYAKKISDFFYSSSISAHMEGSGADKIFRRDKQKRHSFTPNLLILIEMHEKFPNEVGKNEIMLYVDEVLRLLEERYLSIAQIFAQLRLKCLTVS